MVDKNEIQHVIEHGGGYVSSITAGLWLAGYNVAEADKTARMIGVMKWTKWSEPILTARYGACETYPFEGGIAQKPRDCEEYRSGYVSIEFLREVAVENNQVRLAEVLDEHIKGRSNLLATIAPQTVEPVRFNKKKWTAEKLAELKAYRNTNTMEDTAAKFNISKQRIRQLLPSANSKVTPYTSLIHRAK